MNEGHVKLLTLLISYVCFMLIGTFIFMELEYDNEQTQVKHFKDLFEDFYSRSNASKKDINEILRIFRESYSLGIDPSGKYQSKWDMAGSFYFVGTVITTIGFGYTAPATRFGQICFIPYALIGIPLNILLFNTLLDQTVQLFTVLLLRCHQFWRAFKRRIAKQTSGPNTWEPTATSLTLVCVISITVVTVISAPMFQFLEEWTFFESVYFAVVAFTTVGFGDFVPSGGHSGTGQNMTPHYKIGNWIVITIGMVFMYTAMAVIASVYKQLLGFSVEKCRKLIAKRTNRMLVPEGTSTSEHPRAKTGDRGGLSPEEREKLTLQNVLNTWKALKKANHIGTINAVEASILRSRVTPNSRVVEQENSRKQSFSMSATPRTSIAEGLSTADELDAIEARLNREYKQLLNEIKEHRDTIKNKHITSDLSPTEDSIGITNEGIGIAIRISSPPIDEADEFLCSTRSEDLELPSPSSLDWDASPTRLHPST